MFAAWLISALKLFNGLITLGIKFRKEAALVNQSECLQGANCWISPSKISSHPKVNKMSKTLVCTNVLHSVNSLAYGSHCQEWYRLGRSTQDEFILFHPDRFSIDNARNQAAKYALELECDYLFFLDDDMTLSPNTYQSLKTCDGDVVQALTYIRGYPFEPMFFKTQGSDSTNIKLEYFRDWRAHVDQNGIVNCDAVGFACALLKVEVFKQLNPPFFVTSSQQTEDVYYCVKLKQKYPEAKILVDTKVPTGHILHPEVIAEYSREALIEYYKPKEKVSGNDRGVEYLEKTKKLFAAG